jgi:hypothetical protein
MPGETAVVGVMDHAVDYGNEMSVNPNDQSSGRQIARAET